MATKKRTAQDEKPTAGGDTPSAPGAFSREPTAGDIDGMWRYKLAEYEELGLRQYMYEIRQLFDMTHPVRIPREYRVTTKEVRNPLLRDAALRIAAALVKDRPVPAVTPRDMTRQADQASDIAARWLMAVWLEIIKQNNGQDILYQSARALVRDSESVIKVVDRVNAWANFPEREKGEDATKYLRRRDASKQKAGIIQPFAARVVERDQMVFGDGEYGDEWAIEYGRYPTPMVMSAYGLQTVDADPKYVLPKFKLGGKPLAMGYPANMGIGGGTTIKLEYFDKDWWAVVINGKMAPGWPKPNPYAPRLPYFRAIADPVLYSLRYYAPALDALLTGKMNWAFLSMFPVPKFSPVASNQQAGELTMPIGDEATTPVGMRWKPGMAMMPPPGYDLSFLEVPGTGRDVDQLVGILRDFIDIAGIPSIFRGIGGARQAGYAINQLMAAANLAFRQLGMSLQRQFERSSEFLFHIVEDVIGETVYVLGDGDDTKTWLGLKPSGNVTEVVAPIDMLGPVDFRFKPVIPTDEQAMQMIGLQALNSPHQVLSHETVLRDWFQIEDPQGEIDRIAVERAIDTDPVLNQQMRDQALRRAGVPLPPPPAPPSGLVGPDGRPIASAGTPPAPPGPMPNGQTAGGMPSIPGLTQLIRPNAPGPSDIHGGGRPAGSFPGQPSGPERAAA